MIIKFTLFIYLDLIELNFNWYVMIKDGNFFLIYFPIIPKKSLGPQRTRCSLTYYWPEFLFHSNYNLRTQLRLLWVFYVERSSGYVIMKLSKVYLIHILLPRLTSLIIASWSVPLKSDSLEFVFCE